MTRINSWISFGDAEMCGNWKGFCLIFWIFTNQMVSVLAVYYHVNAMYQQNPAAGCSRMGWLSSHPYLTSSSRLFPCRSWFAEPLKA